MAAHTSAWVMFPQARSITAAPGVRTLSGAVYTSCYPDVAELLSKDLAATTLAPDGSNVELRVSPGLPEEGYRLTIDKDVVVEASTRSGALYGTQTLLQLLRSSASRSTVPCGVIEDAPLMPERGQMLDVGRKYLPIAVLKREIRRMAWYKMNSLHLHLTEWNGFRFGSERFPGIASPEHYTLTELRDLDDYARLWGVTIVPEIELPGHAVWLSRYDDRLRFKDASMDTDPHPGGAAGGWMLDVTSDFVRNFCRELLSEVAETFSSPIVHIGGDELPGQDAIDASPALAAWAQEHNLPEPGDTLVDFTNDMAAHLAQHGKRAEIWEWWAALGQRKSIEPDRSIRVSKWLDDHPPTHWAQLGWDTVGVCWDGNFCTPGYAITPLYDGPVGFEGYMLAEKNYERNNYPFGPGVRGYRFARWMDKAEAETYEWCDFYAARGIQVIAERTWSAQGSPTAVDAFERADIVGLPPGEPGCHLTTLPRTAIVGITASSFEQDQEDGDPVHLIDHDRRTTWVSRYTADLVLPPHRIEIELGSSEMIGAVLLVPRQDGQVVTAYHATLGTPKHVVISVSDGDTFETVHDGTFPRTTIEHRFDFEPRLARRVRVEFTSDWANLQIIALSEVRLLAAPRQVTP